MGGVSPFEAINNALPSADSNPPLVSEQTPNYSELPGSFDPFVRLVQDREGEGGMFIQTAGIHRVDVLFALLELAEAEADGLADELDAPPEQEARIETLLDDLRKACGSAQRARHDIAN
jgi:hypothetical protein